MPSLIETNRWQWSALRRRYAAAHMGDACPYCHQPVMPHQPFDLDHARPRAHGGGDEPGNLRLAHRSCNRAAGLAMIRRDEARAPITHMREW